MNVALASTSQEHTAPRWACPPHSNSRRAGDYDRANPMTPAAEHDQHLDRPHPAPAAMALFALLWFVGTFYLWGRLGIWVDDWSIQLRDPETGGVRWAELLSVDPWGTGFWRPFHLHTITWVNTLLWEHQQVIHLFLALMHGLNAWLLWMVLRTMCRTPLAATAGTLLFLTYPAGHEAMFWLSTIGTTIGTAILLLCTLGAQRLARGKLHRLWLVLGIPMLLTIACWYEQPAACAPLIGLAYFAAAPAHLPIRRRLAGMIIIGALAIVGLVVYAGMLIGTAPTGNRGGASSFVTAAQAWPQAKMVLGQVKEQLLLERFGFGALREGWLTVIGRPRQAVVVGVLLVLSAAAFARWWLRTSTLSDSTRASSNANKLAGRLQQVASLGFGVGVTLASVAPVMAIQAQWYSSRLAYVTVLGFALITGLVTDWTMVRAQRRDRGTIGRVGSAAGLAVLIGMSVTGVLMLVGVQSAWVKRQLMDQRVSASLRAAVPNPPPDALFVPVRLSDRLSRTGSTRYDNFCVGPFDIMCSPTSFVQHAYQRNDIYALASNRWAEGPESIQECQGGLEEGLAIRWNKWPAPESYLRKQFYRLVPWSKVVAFEVLKNGRVRLIDTVYVEDAENTALDRTVRLSAAGPATAYGGRPLVVNARTTNNQSAAPTM